MLKNILPFALITLSLLLFNGCQEDDDDNIVITSTSDFSSQVILDWVDLTLKLSKETPGFSPPVTARTYGYSGLALYEAVQLGQNDYRSLQGQLNEFTSGTVPSPANGDDLHWGAVANSTLGTFFRNTFQTTSANNLSLMANLEEDYTSRFLNESSEDVINRSVAFGEAVGEAILAFASSDNQDESYNSNFPASYTPPVGTGLWVPTSTDSPIPLQPYWGSVRPFLVSNIADLLPIPPTAYSTDPSSLFYQEAMEVYEAVVNVTPEQRTIAEFWSDDPGNTATPPGHSYAIMLQILRAEGVDLMRASEIYAKMGFGVHDAFISCWNAKYVYNLVRPITYVHEFIDPTWVIPLSTPPFPEYTSGHSVQSGAVAKILTDEFGENYAFLDSTHVSRTDIDGTPRPFNSFYGFAEEAAVSRLYGGIHFRPAIDIGVDQGILVGRNIGALNFR